METNKYYNEYFDVIKKPHLKNNHDEKYRKKALLWQENHTWIDKCLSRPEVEEISFTPDVLQQDGVNLTTSNTYNFLKKGDFIWKKWLDKYTTIDEKEDRSLKKEVVDHVHLMMPICEHVDYSEYSNLPKYENVLFAKKYKDGILLIANNVSKDIWPYLTIRICDRSENNDIVKGKTVFSMLSKTDSNGEPLEELFFKNYGQIDWSDKCFDDKIVLYVLVPKMHKTMATKLVIRNNIKIKKLLDVFKENIKENGPVRPLPSGKLKYFFESVNLATGVTQGMRAMKKDGIAKTSVEYLKKKEMLKAGREAALMEIINFIQASTASPFKRSYWKLLNKYIDMSFEDLKKLYFKYIYPVEYGLDIARIQNMPKNTMHGIYKIYCRKLFIKFALFYSHTNRGEKLPNGEFIENEDKSIVDNLLYWKQVDLFELFTGIINTKNYPLLIRDSQIINDMNFWEEKVENYFSYAMKDRPDIKPDNIFGKKYFEFKDRHILEEIKNNQTGYLMPYDGAHELLHDLVFIAIKFREYENFITIIIFDDKERYLVEVFDKQTWDFQYKLFDQLKFNENFSDECMQEIYTKLATCIRDAKVLVERDSSMQYQGRRRPYGSKTSSVYHIYFPRVRYRRNKTHEQIKKEKSFFNESRKFNGTRRAHVRKLTIDQKPSKKQLLLAKRLDIYVPAGSTFVKESEWGNNMTKREKIYRNTALNGLFYYDNKEISEAEKINQLSPAGFEEYCKEYIKKQGYSIKKSNNYDGGIDIRAFKILDDEKTLYAVVQCKHWKTPIPPGEMRDFITACNLEKTEHEKVKMFITSSKFSPKARSLAEEHNIELIDGDILLG
jgi:hypothetical protein